MIHSLSLGAGVQSSTLALMAERGEIIPKPDFGIFSDTQNEPEEVYRWLDWLIPKLSFPIYKVTAGDLAAESLKLRISKKSGKLYSRSLMPVFIQNPNGSKGILGRRCTTDYKLDPIIRKLTELVKPPRAKKGKTPEILATQWIGISWDEADRMKDPLRPWIANYYPLVEKKITRRDCIEWMNKNGFPEPPRSACRQCPFHSDDEWVRLKTEQPEDFEKAVLFEQAYQLVIAADQTTNGTPFLHDSLVPLNQVKFVPGHKEEQFRNECQGLCGV